MMLSGERQKYPEEKQKYLEEKPVSVPLYTPQVPHSLAWE
jgi:hypothetical protein